MGKKPLALRVDEELLRRVDEARGDVPRTRWVERALEEKLNRRSNVAEVERHKSAHRTFVEADRALKDAPEDLGVSEKPKRGAYVCPVKSCGRAFGVSTAVCPSHGRKVVSLVSE